MEELKKYIQSIEAMSDRENFATRCGTSLKHLQNIYYGYKTPSESLCINIERESRGVVRCELLRSDVDWNYIRNTKAA